MTAFPMRRLRFVCEEPLKYGINAAAQYDDPRWPRFVRITDISESGKLRDDTFRSLPLETAKDYLLEEGDILLARSGSIGRTFIYQPEWGEACFAGYLVRARLSREFCPRFIYWSLNTLHYWSWIESTAIRSTIQNVSAERYAEYAVPSPPLATQRRIARFLDEKTARIDRLIEKKRVLLDLLAEKRQALITRAVTRGLDPDAYSELPKGWTRRRLRFDVSINPPKSSLDMEPDELVSFIPMDAVGEYGGLVLDNVRELDEVYNGYTYFADGDICIAKITPCFENGKGALAEGLVNGVGFGTTELHVVRPGPNIDPRFLFYASIADDFRKLGEAEMYGAGGQKRINENFIKNWLALLPSLPTQQYIAHFLDQKTKQIDEQKELVLQSIDGLAEYRSALITAAVTGQMAELQ